MIAVCFGVHVDINLNHMISYRALNTLRLGYNKIGNVRVTEH